MNVQNGGAQRSEDLLLAAMTRAGASPREMVNIRKSFEDRLARTKGGQGLDWEDRRAMWVRAACVGTDNSTFAARLGFALRHEGNLIEYIARHARDLRSLIQDTGGLHKVDSPALGWTLLETENEARMVFSWSGVKHFADHRLVEFAVFTALARIRAATRSVVAPIEIRFTHQVPIDAGRYRQVAGCPVIFGSHEIALVFSPSAIEMPIPTHDPDLHAHLTGYGQRLLAEEGPAPNTVRTRVESVLTDALPDHMPAVDDVAGKLGMSTRTLHRKLLREGISFRDIVGEMRNDLAQTMIKDEMRISEIAYALGYSDQSSFTTAFRRWNGVSPRQFRANQEAPRTTKQCDATSGRVVPRDSTVLHLPVQRVG
ncbi:HTH-type transcriptional regulator VirS [Shimia sp. SK013]|uniref:AraC family transcriptional regulator n=1 Tax=Shimia sp. SK013 TaxID=1389006 RepID=UPI0006CC7810|nr:AraC family transcriptional regulator [Shimia sp. SK013]KPA21394.1 HTH-type transcriptional regulator VirS [Shimia sp. SK013]